MKTIRKAFDGLVEQVSEDELANAAACADRTGSYTCPHTGVALAALFNLVDRGLDPKGPARDCDLHRPRVEILALQG